MSVCGAFQWSQQGRIGPQEIPRSPDVDPSRRKAESMDIALRHQDTNRIGDLEFTAGRFRCRVDEGKNVFVEHVDARIDQVRFRLPWFFLEGRDFPVLHFHDTERTGIRDFGQGHDRPAHLPVEREKLREGLSRYDDVAIHAEEGTIHVPAHASDGMGGPETFSLFLVRDREFEVRAISETFPDPMAMPSDENRQFLDPGGAQRLERVSKERLAGHRQKGLRKIRGEGPHPRALTGREDYGLHAAAPLALDRTVEYISFALASFRDSANTRIFGSVPEKRTRAQASSNWSLHPSTVLKSAGRSRSEASNRDSTFARPSVEYATAPRITG